MPIVLKPGWVSLRDPAAFVRVEKEEWLDARFKRAAALMRARWDKYNEDHGIEYDYDDYGTAWESEAAEDSWSEGDAEDPEVFDDWI
jgi:hypothetical protein